MFAAAFLLVASFSVSAQYAATSGRVELVKADGSREPVVGATVDLYRTDTKGGSPSDKTDKKGSFSFAGLLLGGTYVLSVSGPNIRPAIYPNVKPGQERLVVDVEPGDGSKYTEEEVLEALKNAKAAPVGNSGGGGLSAEDAKKKAEYDAKVKEITEKKAKADSAFATVKRTLTEGGAAFEAKNFDLAIAKFGEGIDADPDFIGTAPRLSNYKALAYKDRAVDNYNKSVKAFNDGKKTADAAKLAELNTAKTAAFASVRSDLGESLKYYSHALEIIKNAPAADLADPKIADTYRGEAIRGAKDTLKAIVASSQIPDNALDLAPALVDEYTALEKDPVKQNEARLHIADIYRLKEDRENAIKAYKKVLETSPDNLDALAGAGLVMVDLGWLDGDAAKSQEGANLLQRFVAAAPDTHIYKEGAVGYLEVLKEQKIVPVKSAGKRKN